MILVILTTGISGGGGGGGSGGSDDVLFASPSFSIVFTDGSFHLRTSEYSFWLVLLEGGTFPFTLFFPHKQ